MSTHRLADARTETIVAEVGDRLAVDVREAEVLHQHANAVIALPASGWVIRIATAPDALERVAASVRVTRWLAGRGFPCVVPADGVDQPLVVRGCVVSLWQRIDTATAPGPDAAGLARVLKQLHDQPELPFPLHRFEDPFDDVASAIAQCPGALSSPARTWLVARIDELRALWPHLPFTRPWALMHGDAHPNNLMHTTDGRIVLGDWDHTAIGPREWDLAQVHYTRRRFHRPSDADTDALAAAYGWDIREWEGLDTVISSRELTGLSPYIRTAADRAFARDELARRVHMLQGGDTTTRWTSPADS
ncbi:phosphotransferase family protein [Streptomyces sp. NPDC001889]